MLRIREIGEKKLCGDLESLKFECVDGFEWMV